jgi:hypothetical protein
MSGYAEPMIGKSGVLDPSVMLLDKPFTAPALLAKVHEALASPATMPPDLLRTR